MTDEQKAEELKNGSEDDIYLWLASVPDSFHPITNEGMRIQRDIGFNKIGYCKDLPPERRKYNTGVYIHDMWCSDPKTNWLIRQVAGLFIVGAKVANFKDLYNRAKQDNARLAREVAGQDITHI